MKNDLKRKGKAALILVLRILKFSRKTWLTMGIRIVCGKIFTKINFVDFYILEISVPENWAATC